MLRFQLQKSMTEDDDLTLLIDEAGLETLMRLVHAAQQTGHEHLIETEGRVAGLTNLDDPLALKHVLVDWCGVIRKPNRTSRMG